MNFTIKQNYLLISDQELLDSFYKQNDKKALAHLYIRYTSSQFGICMKYLKDKEAAKDMIQDIFEKISRKLITTKVDNFRAWLFFVTKNACLNKLAKNKKIFIETAHLPFDFKNDIYEIDHIIEKEKKLNELEKCISNLSTQQQKVLKLFFFEKFCYSQIAEMMQIEWGNVRSVLQNSKRNLRICLENNKNLFP